ncbi:hypothetical protein M440DRAFT_1396448 [Trichoderma longibrachiatum ATCC 18648]|uniref:Uncharacterized protein n=1 Tax=Trichoderma longibrachiatum ATCC 18648 TaxID=983965 RepID=A0A2T4CIG7_TRILO|nr:hypothetical protein M440DRAFT_1396448 [Trichoderma longibrachiatum ATCC 18648]
MEAAYVCLLACNKDDLQREGGEGERKRVRDNTSLGQDKIYWLAFGQPARVLWAQDARSGGEKARGKLRRTGVFSGMIW